jgi:hypothetical protein
MTAGKASMAPMDGADGSAECAKYDEAAVPNAARVVAVLADSGIAGVPPTALAVLPEAPRTRMFTSRRQ